MNFKSIDKKYRPIPFWSWNERLDTEETRRQVRLMNDAGIGGYFMHARGGLQTEYMSDEWFDNIRAASDEGKALGMYSWAYDENGWPSGFGDGRVSGLGLDYWQKSLHIELATADCAVSDENILLRDGYRYYYKTNRFYVDVLDERVIARFIDEIYREYADKCGDAITGFFTDEPQILRDTGYPWSFTLPEKFRDAYGYDLVDSLDSLFFEVGDFERVRLDYWKLVTRLFSESYMKQIYDFCTSHGYGFTGHMVLEESLYSQLVSNGAVMPNYEYFTIPGMDWLCRPIRDCLTPVQLASAAAQTGKRQILSETFAAAGHNVSHGELKRIFEWQMVRGVTLLCTHLEGYSNRGIRKRDYPPALYYQQPWWPDMHIFFDTVSRIGMLLTEGRVVADTLLMHPQSTAWRLYDGDELGDNSKKRILEYNSALLADMRTLEDKHILYHLGDETLIERHGRIENGEFVIGEMRYTTVVLPKNLGFLPYTEKLLAEFRAVGGRIVTADAVELNPVCGINRLTYTRRDFDGFTLHYFVNSDNAEIRAEIAVGNLVLDPETCDTRPFDGTHTFEAYSSLILIDDGGERAAKMPENLNTPLDLSGKWSVKSASHNSLTLDTCDYYFDGELIERDGYVLNILPRINEKKRRVSLRQTYRFTSDGVTDGLFLATETPELFRITVNGREIAKNDAGYFRDSSFRMIPLDNLISGENVIELFSEIEQRPETYEHIDSALVFESMKNNLTYDMEIEPIYIVGDFGLRLVGEIEEIANDAYRVDGRPIIVPSPREVEISDLAASGYPEFAGELVLTREITVDDRNRTVRLLGRGMNSVTLAVNGKTVATRMFAPYTIDLSEHLIPGKNQLEIRILNNLRNMMGPHHLASGESYTVTPTSFFKEKNVFLDCGDSEELKRRWSDGICLVHFGIGEK